MNEKEQADRILDIINLRKQRMTYDEIGLKYDISRERVRQLLKLHAPSLTGFGKARKKQPVLVERICRREACQKVFHTTPSLRRAFCSKECFQSNKYGEVNPYPREDRRYQKWRYEMDKRFYPEEVRARQERSLAGHKKRLAEDPEYRARHKLYIKNYYSLKRKQ